MSTSPADTPVTTPALFTVAIAVFDDCHVAWLVTFWFAPDENVAVAVSCAVNPIVGALPVTATDVTDAVGVVGESPLLRLHAATVTAATTAVDVITMRVRTRAKRRQYILRARGEKQTIRGHLSGFQSVLQSDEMHCEPRRLSMRRSYTPRDLLTLVSENADRLTHRAFLARQRGAKTSG